ncbi:MAG: hypothetical protein ACREYE_30940 [Gammaproteobacteria bacterium]
MSETIAITGKSVKLFKGHYTSTDSHQSNCSSSSSARSASVILLSEYRPMPSSLVTASATLRALRFNATTAVSERTSRRCRQRVMAIRSTRVLQCADRE